MQKTLNNIRIRQRDPNALYPYAPANLEVQYHWAPNFTPSTVSSNNLRMTRGVNGEYISLTFDGKETHRTSNLGSTRTEAPKRKSVPRTVRSDEQKKEAPMPQGSEKQSGADVLSGINHTAAMVSLFTPFALAGDTYFALLGAKEFANGNVLGGAAYSLPFLYKGYKFGTLYLNKPLSNLRFIRNAPIPEQFEGTNLEFLPDGTRTYSGTPTSRVYLSPDENALTNLTWDLPFVLHNHYKHRPSFTYQVVDPQAFAGRAPLSVKPSDTFFANLPIDLKYITIISGNPAEIALAKLLGYKVMEDSKLNDIYNKIMSENGPLAKKPTANLEYNQRVTDLIRETYGSVGLEDALRLGYQTNLSTGVVPNWPWLSFISKNKHIRGVPSYDKLLYNPASSIEADLMEQFGAHSNPKGWEVPPYNEMVNVVGSRPLRIL